MNKFAKFIEEELNLFAHYKEVVEELIGNIEEKVLVCTIFSKLIFFKESTPNLTYKLLLLYRAIQMHG